MQTGVKGAGSPNGPYESLSERHERIRVLVLGQVPPPVHGSNVVTRTILDTLSSIGCDAVLVRKDLSFTIDEVGSFGVRKPFRAVRYLARALVSRLRADPHLVISLPAGSVATTLIDAFALRIASCGNVPSTAYFLARGYGSERFSGYMSQHIAAFLMRAIDRPVVQSARLAEDIAQWFEPDEIAVIPLALEELLPARSYDDSSSAKVQVLFLSNLLPAKGPLIFVDLAKRILADGAVARFTLVGARADDETYSALKEAARSTTGIALGEPRFGRELYELFRTADIFVFPSAHEAEAFPLVVLHAMEASVPVVATDVGGVADMVVNGTTGWVVEPGDFDALLRRTSALIGDRAARVRLGSNGRKRLCAEYSQARFKQNWQSIVSVAHSLAVQGDASVPRDGLG